MLISRLECKTRQKFYSRMNERDVDFCLITTRRSLIKAQVCVELHFHQLLLLNEDLPIKRGYQHNPFDVLDIFIKRGYQYNPFNVLDILIKQSYQRNPYDVLGQMRSCVLRRFQPWNSRLLCLRKTI
jgi:hypothetical protein